MTKRASRIFVHHTPSSRDRTRVTRRDAMAIADQVRRESAVKATARITLDGRCIPYGPDGKPIPSQSTPQTGVSPRRTGNMTRRQYVPVETKAPRRRVVPAYRPTIG